jgi:hypothetical protein
MVNPSSNEIGTQSFSTGAITTCRSGGAGGGSAVVQVYPDTQDPNIFKLSAQYQTDTVNDVGLWESSGQIGGDFTVHNGIVPHLRGTHDGSRAVGLLITHSNTTDIELRGWSQSSTDEADWLITTAPYLVSATTNILHVSEKAVYADGHCRLAVTTHETTTNRVLIQLIDLDTTTLVISVTAMYTDDEVTDPNVTYLVATRLSSGDADGASRVPCVLYAVVNPDEETPVTSMAQTRFEGTWEALSTPVMTPTYVGGITPGVFVVRSVIDKVLDDTDRLRMFLSTDVQNGKSLPHMIATSTASTGAIDSSTLTVSALYVPAYIDQQELPSYWEDMAVYEDGSLVVLPARGERLSHGEFLTAERSVHIWVYHDTNSGPLSTPVATEISPLVSRCTLTYQPFLSVDTGENFSPMAIAESDVCDVHLIGTTWTPPPSADTTTNTSYCITGIHKEVTGFLRFAVASTGEDAS